MGSKEELDLPDSVEGSSSDDDPSQGGEPSLASRVDGWQRGELNLMRLTVEKAAAKKKRLTGSTLVKTFFRMPALEKEQAKLA